MFNEESKEIFKKIIADKVSGLSEEDIEIMADAAFEDENGDEDYSNEINRLRWIVSEERRIIKEVEKEKRKKEKEESRKKREQNRQRRAASSQFQPSKAEDRERRDKIKKEREEKLKEKNKKKEEELVKILKDKWSNFKDLKTECFPLDEIWRQKPLNKSFLVKKKPKFTVLAIDDPENQELELISSLKETLNELNKAKLDLEKAKLDLEKEDSNNEEEINQKSAQLAIINDEIKRVSDEINDLEKQIKDVDTFDQFVYDITLPDGTVIPNVSEEGLEYYRKKFELEIRI